MSLKSSLNPTFWLLSLLLLGIMTACTDLSYQMEENGCDTGKQSFDSKDAYCKGLKDETLNKGCAADLRDQKFKADCSSS